MRPQLDATVQCHSFEPVQRSIPTLGERTWPWTVCEMGRESSRLYCSRVDWDLKAQRYALARERFSATQAIAPTVPKIIAKGPAPLGTLPKFPLPNPAA
jgi:hypothetical protein